MADEGDRDAHLRRRHSEPNDDASFVVKAEVGNLIREELERIGVDASTPASRQRTQRNFAFLDRMGEREAEIVRALDFVNLLIGRQKSADDRRRGWIAIGISLVGALVGALGVMMASGSGHHG